MFMSSAVIQWFVTFGMFNSSMWNNLSPKKMIVTEILCKSENKLLFAP